MAKKMSKSVKTAIICGSAVFVLIILVLIKFNSAETTSVESSKETNSQIDTSAGTVDIVPGTSDRKSYNELQQKENEKNAKEALDKGKSTLPILVNNNKDDKNDPFDDLNLNIVQPIVKEETPVIDTTPPEVPAPVIQPVVQQPQVAQPAPLPAPVYNANERSNARQKVNAQVQGYFAQWAVSPATQERDMTGVDLDKFEKSQAERVSQTTSGGNSYNQGNSTSGATLIRAGTIIPAVMVTALDSDNPGPVIADIVAGEFKGGRLIGQMKSTNNQIVIQFNQLSMKGHNKTYSINAFAIDPNTTRTGLASDVNNHYFLRYGLGLAAAFISGYGEAVQNKGTTTTIGPMGNVTQTKGDLNHSEIAESALGKMGQKLGSELDKDTNRRPTVTVDSGVAVGILFMNDF